MVKRTSRSLRRTHATGPKDASDATNSSCCVSLNEKPSKERGLTGEGVDVVYLRLEAHVEMQAISGKGSSAEGDDELQMPRPAVVAAAYTQLLARNNC